MHQGGGEYQDFLKWGRLFLVYSLMIKINKLEWVFSQNLHFDPPPYN